MAPDWLYDAVQAFQLFMTGASGTQVALMLGMSLFGLPALVLIHELGHAVAALAFGHSLRELQVGDQADLVVRVGRFTLQLGRSRDSEAPGGFVTHLGPGGARALLTIAASGPAANLLAGAGLAYAGASGSLDGPILIPIWILVVQSVGLAAYNLYPAEAPDGSDRSDGRSIQLAWEALRTACRSSPRPDATEQAYVDPHAATSVAPPGS